jgi:hypothetical protein
LGERERGGGEMYNGLERRERGREERERGERQRVERERKDASKGWYVNFPTNEPLRKIGR